MKNNDVRNQIEQAYKKMADVNYRPAAPSDGFGNITVPAESLDIQKEISKYADSWWRAEDIGEFHIGCCNFRTRPATIFAIEAARLMCGAADEFALKLLEMSVTELRKAIKGKATP